MNWPFYTLIALMLIGGAVGIYCRRKITNSRAPNLRRAQMLAVMTALFVLVSGMLILGNFRSATFSSRQIVSCTSFVLFVGTMIFQIRKIWPQARAERAKLRRLKSRPTFFWQGTLILLPLLALTSIGILAIFRERRLVEDEARARAREVLDQLSGSMGRLVAAELSEFERMSGYWRSFYEGISDWPGAKDRKSTRLNSSHQ